MPTQWNVQLGFDRNNEAAGLDIALCNPNSPEQPGPADSSMWRDFYFKDSLIFTAFDLTTPATPPITEFPNFIFSLPAASGCEPSAPVGSAIPNLIRNGGTRVQYTEGPIKVEGGNGVSTPNFNGTKGLPAYELLFSSPSGDPIGTENGRFTLQTGGFTKLVLRLAVTLTVKDESGQVYSFLGDPEMQVGGPGYPPPSG